MRKRKQEPQVGSREYPAKLLPDTKKTVDDIIENWDNWGYSEAQPPPEVKEKKTWIPDHGKYLEEDALLDAEKELEDGGPEVPWKPHIFAKIYKALQPLVLHKEPRKNSPLMGRIIQEGTVFSCVEMVPASDKEAQLYATEFLRCARPQHIKVKPEEDKTEYGEGGWVPTHGYWKSGPYGNLLGKQLVVHFDTGYTL